MLIFFFLVIFFPFLIPLRTSSFLILCDHLIFNILLHSRFTSRHENLQKSYHTHFVFKFNVSLNSSILFMKASLAIAIVAFIFVTLLQTSVTSLLRHLTFLTCCSLSAFTPIWTISTFHTFMTIFSVDFKVGTFLH